eukprot:jgi/Tetstr1/428025/TSEL_000170.t1
MATDSLPPSFSKRGVTLRWLSDFCSNLPHALRDAEAEYLWERVVCPKLEAGRFNCYVELPEARDSAVPATHCVLQASGVPLAVVVRSLMASFPAPMHEQVAVWMPLFSFGRPWNWNPYQSERIHVEDFGCDAAAVLQAAAEATAGQVLVLLDPRGECFSSWPCMFALATGHDICCRQSQAGAPRAVSLLPCVANGTDSPATSQRWAPPDPGQMAAVVMQFTVGRLRAVFSDKAWGSPEYGLGIPPERVLFNHWVREAVAAAVTGMGRAAAQSDDILQLQIAVVAAQALAATRRVTLASTLCRTVLDKLTKPRGDGPSAQLHAKVEIDARWILANAAVEAGDASADPRGAQREMRDMLETMASMPEQYPLHLAELLLTHGDTLGARNQARQSMACYQEAGVPWQRWAHAWLDHAKFMATTGDFQTAEQMLRGALSGTLPEGQPDLVKLVELRQPALVVLGEVLTLKGDLAGADDALGGFIGFQDGFWVRPAPWSTEGVKHAWRLAFVGLLLSDGDACAIALAEENIRRALRPGFADERAERLVQYGELLLEKQHVAPARALLRLAQALQGTEHPDLRKLSAQLASQPMEGEPAPPASLLDPQMLPWPLLASSHTSREAATAYTKRGVTVRCLRRLAELVRYSRDWASWLQGRGHSGLPEHASPAEGYDMASVTDVVDAFVKPATAALRTCYAALPGVPTHDAKALVCCSHDAPFADLVHALVHRFRDCLETPVWLDFLCCSQHPTEEAQPPGGRVSAEVAQEVESVVIVLDWQGRCFRSAAAASPAAYVRDGLWLGEAEQAALPEILICERRGRPQRREIDRRPGAAWLPDHEAAAVWAEMCASSREAASLHVGPQADDTQQMALLNLWAHALAVGAVAASKSAGAGALATAACLLLHGGRYDLASGSLSAASHAVRDAGRGDADGDRDEEVEDGGVLLERLAELAIEGGDVDAARELMRGHRGETARAAYVQGRLALAGGDPAAAKPLLQRCQAQLADSSKGNSMISSSGVGMIKREMAPLEALAACAASRACLATGDGDAALSVLVDVVDRWPEAAPRAYLARVQHRYAEAMVAHGRPDAAGPHISVAKVAYRELLGSDHPWWAALLSLEARCEEEAQALRAQAGSYTAFTTNGVTVRWLVDHFHPRMRAALPGAASDITTQEVVAAVVKPDTVSRQCLYAALPGVPSKPAQYFVSHVWRRPFYELLYCVWRRFRDDLDAVIWLDIFSFNQHKIMQDEADGLAALEWLEDTVKRVTTKTLVVLDPEGTCFQRAWCLLEHHTAVVSRPRGIFPLPTTTGSKAGRGGAAGAGKLEVLPYLAFDTHKKHTDALRGALLPGLEADVDVFAGPDEHAPEKPGSEEEGS